MPPQAARSRASSDLQAILAAMPGSIGEPMTASRGALPLVLIYKVMGKMFAILALRGDENVILKCDAHLVDILREQYAGVGHRSHLDRRFWISVDLQSDVPAEEVRSLALRSYALVCDGLSRKQRTELAALAKDIGDDSVGISSPPGDLGL